MKTKQITFFVYWRVSFPEGNEGETSKEYNFESEEEANKCACVPFGCYNSKGNVDEMLTDIDQGEPNVQLYMTADEWGRQNLIAAMYLKHFSS